MTDDTTETGERQSSSDLVLRADMVAVWRSMRDIFRGLTADHQRQADCFQRQADGFRKDAKHFRQMTDGFQKQADECQREVEYFRKRTNYCRGQTNRYQRLIDAE